MYWHNLIIDVIVVVFALIVDIVIVVIANI